MEKYSMLVVSAFLCLLAMSLVSWGKEEGGEVTATRVPPILTKADLPPEYELDGCGKLLEHLTKQEDGRDLSFDYIREIWRSVSDQELAKLMKGKPEDRATKVTWINVKRWIFKTRKEALENVGIALMTPMGFPPEGSFSGVRIGEKCWSNKGKFGQRGSPLVRHITFIKKNQVVDVDVLRFPEPDAQFVEKLALIVASRI